MISIQSGEISLEWIKRAVLELIEKHNTNDPFEIGSNEKIHIIPRYLHHELHGFYKYIRRNKFIFINKNLDTVMRRFVCAHELGHAVLHPYSNTPFLRANTLFSIDRIEVEANTFAVELLIPNETFYLKNNDPTTIREVASIYGVPEGIVHLRNFNSQVVGSLNHTYNNI
jgi:Zn-dependent peptidase ImmA (M78 family)